VKELKDAYFGDQKFFAWVRTRGIVHRFGLISQAFLQDRLPKQNCKLCGVHTILEPGVLVCALSPLWGMHLISRICPLWFLGQRTETSLAAERLEALRCLKNILESSSIVFTNWGHFLLNYRHTYEFAAQLHTCIFKIFLELCRLEISPLIYCCCL
jgi:hypothetical protein